MNPVCDRVVMAGLDDWLSLSAIHSRVAESYPSRPLTETQSVTLETIHMLVRQELAQLGQLSELTGRFRAYEMPIGECLKDLENAYIAYFYDASAWAWWCWLQLAEKGETVARSLIEQMPGPQRAPVKIGAPDLVY